MNRKKPKKQLNQFVRFSGIAIQMGLTIYLGSMLGKWLDQKFPNDSELYLKICTITAVFSTMYSVIRQVSKRSKNDD